MEHGVGGARSDDTFVTTSGDAENPVVTGASPLMSPNDVCVWIEAILECDRLALQHRHSLLLTELRGLSVGVTALDDFVARLPLPSRPEITPRPDDVPPRHDAPSAPRPTSSPLLPVAAGPRAASGSKDTNISELRPLLGPY